jgi:hypothetical protein
VKFKKNHAIKLVCPFTPWLDAHGRSTTCVADRCIQWVWTGKKGENNDERYGFCGLNNDNKIK